MNNASLYEHISHQIYIFILPKECFKKVAMRRATNSHQRLQFGWLIVIHWANIIIKGTVRRASSIFSFFKSTQHSKYLQTRFFPLTKTDELQYTAENERVERKVKFGWWSIGFLTTHAGVSLLPCVSPGLVIYSSPPKGGNWLRAVGFSFPKL